MATLEIEGKTFEVDGDGFPDFDNASPKNIFQKISSKNISNDSCFFVRSIVFIMVLPLDGARYSVSCMFNAL